MKKFFSSEKVQSTILITLILLLTLTVFFSCRHFSFLAWDDEGHLTQNPLVRELSLSNIVDIFKQKVNTTYHPLTTLSFAIEYHFAQYNPFVYHLDNVLLHLGVTFFIFIFLRQLGLSVWTAALAVLFFAIHPTRVESIAWTTERKDLLYGFFYAAGLVAYLHYRKTDDKRFYVLTFFLALLSILSKAMALSFPLILCLCDWYQGRKISKKAILEKLPIFLIIIAIASITYVENARIPIKDYYQALLIWVWTFTFYFKKFFFPGVLLPIYDTPRPIAFLNLPFLSGFIIFGIVISILFFGRRLKWLLFSFGFYFLSIFFLLRFDYGFDVHPVADRFLYLPSLGFCLFIAFFVEFIFKKIPPSQRWVKILIVFALAVLIVKMAFRTYAQSQVWKDDYSLWSYQMKYNFNTPIACNNLCLALELGPRAKQYAKDLVVFRENVDKNPDYLAKVRARADFNDFREIDDVKNLAEKQFILLSKAFYPETVSSEPIANMGILYGRLGLPDLAIAYMTVAIRENRGYLKAYYDLAALYARLRRDEDSIKKYQELLQVKNMDPFECSAVLKEYDKVIAWRLESNEDASAFIKARKELYLFLQAYRKNLLFKKGEKNVAYQELGPIYDGLQDDVVAATFQAELDKDPHNPVTLLTLGNAYLNQKDYSEAIKIYLKLLELYPRSKEGYLNAGVAFHKLKQYDVAINCYQKAIELDPKNAMAYFDLAYAYEEINEDKEAISFYKKAIDLKPDYFTAYYNIGNIWVKLNHASKAEQAYRQALEIEPNHADSAMNLSMILFYQKKFEEADTFCKRAQSLGYTPPESYLQALDSQVRNLRPGK